MIVIVYGVLIPFGISVAVAGLMSCVAEPEGFPAHMQAREIFPISERLTY